MRGSQTVELKDERGGKGHPASASSLPLPPPSFLPPRLISLSCNVLPKKGKHNDRTSGAFLFFSTLR